MFTAGNVAYSISAWVKLAAGQEPAGVNFGVNQPNLTGEDGWNQYPWVTNRATVTDAEWVQLTGTFTPDADNPPAELYVEAATATAVILLDDVLITAPDGSSSGPQPGTVLIDTDFEDGTLQGWVPRVPDATPPTLSVVADGADGTARAAQVSDRDNDGDGLQYDVAGVTGLGGTTLEFEAWVRFAPGTDPGEATLSARTVTGDAQAFSNLASLTGLRNDSWTRVGGQFVMPGFDAAAELYFETRYQSGNTSTFLVDEIRVWVPEPPVVQTDLEPLKKQNLGKAEKDLEKIQGTTPFMRAYIAQDGLGGHSIPVSRGALEVLCIVGAISDTEAEKGQVPGLERAIPKNKGVEFGSLLQQIGAEYYASPGSTKLKSILLEIDPDAKDRMVKRQARLESEAAAAQEAAKEKRQEARAAAIAAREQAANEAREAAAKAAAKAQRARAKQSGRPEDAAAAKKKSEAAKPAKPESPKAEAPKSEPAKVDKKSSAKGLTKKKPR